jgi:hypothetical protein
MKSWMQLIGAEYIYLVNPTQKQQLIFIHVAVSSISARQMIALFALLGDAGDASAWLTA